MMLLSKSLEKGASNRLFLKVIKLNDDKDTLLNCEIIDAQMKGIFISGEYTLVDGHVYFNNNAIKLRYDLMKKYPNRSDLQQIFFNQYTDILNLREGETLKTNCPIDSPTSHRFTYVAINHRGPKRLILMPYLHERKIFLNRKKRNTEYFYTSIESGGCSVHPQRHSHIFAYNLTESKFYSYSEKGILENRIEFSELINEYGEIICASPDGLNFALHNRRNDTITILRFNKVEIFVLKTLSIENSLKEYLSNPFDENKSEQCQWIFELMEHDKMCLKYDVQINNRGHILLQISYRCESKQVGECKKWKKLSPKVENMLLNNENKTV